MAEFPTPDLAPTQIFRDPDGHLFETSQAVE